MPNPPTQIDAGDTTDVGTGPQFAYDNHEHAVNTAGAGEIAEISDSTSAAGTSDALPRADHVHPHGNRGGGSLHALAVPNGDAGFFSGVDKDKLDNIPADAAPNQTVNAGDGLVGGGSGAVITLDVAANADGSIVANPNDIQVGVLATDAQHGNRGGGSQHALAVPSGAAGFFSGADQQTFNDMQFAAAPITIQAGDTGSAGVNPGRARWDHRHPVATETSAANIADVSGTTASVGTSTNLVRADHVHYHGALGGGVLHALATAGVAGFMSAADKAKLDSITPGALALYETSQNDAVASTSGTTLTTALSLVTSNLVAGDYRIEWFAELDVANVLSDQRVRISYNAGANVLSDVQYDFILSGVYSLQATGFATVTLSGVHTILIEHARVGGILGNVNIRRRRLSIQRVA